MTEEQLHALEDWIVAIIRKEDRASDLHEALHCHRVREAVEVAFGLRDINK
jgi:hypothetical protein